jgi:hypothetical protein
VSQQSVEPNVDMNTGFANGHVVGDIHTAKGSLSPLSDIYKEGITGQGWTFLCTLIP